MENTASPAPVPPVPTPSTKRGFPYQTVVLIVAVAAFFMSGKGWLMFVLGPLAVFNFIVALIETLIYRSKEQRGTLHHWAWPVLLSYQIAFFLGCFSAPFAGDTSDSTAFTFIPIADTSGSALYNFSYVIAVMALMTSLLIGVAALVFVFIRSGHTQAVSSTPTTAAAPTVISNVATIETVASPVTTQGSETEATPPKNAE